jgi:hypothetical protein
MSDNILLTAVPDSLLASRSVSPANEKIGAQKEPPHLLVREEPQKRDTYPESFVFLAKMVFSGGRVTLPRIK